MREINSWRDLQQGDKVFLMVPEAIPNTKHIQYRPQTAKLIKARERQISYDGTVIWTIKFKYTDSQGKRKPLTIEIPRQHIKRSTICSLNKLGSRKLTYGEMLISFNTLDLARTYNNMLCDETKKIQQHIDEEYAVISKINKTFISIDTFDLL